MGHVVQIIMHVCHFSHADTIHDNERAVLQHPRSLSFAQIEAVITHSLLDIRVHIPSNVQRAFVERRASSNPSPIVVGRQHL